MAHAQQWAELALFLFVTAFVVIRYSMARARIESDYTFARTRLSGRLTLAEKNADTFKEEARYVRELLQQERSKSAYWEYETSRLRAKYEPITNEVVEVTEADVESERMTTVRPPSLPFKQLHQAAEEALVEALTDFKKAWPEVELITKHRPAYAKDLIGIEWEANKEGAYAALVARYKQRELKVINSGTGRYYASVDGVVCPTPFKSAGEAQLTAINRADQLAAHG